MNRLITQSLVLTLMLLGLPLLGVWLSGHTITRYLEFPPHTIHVNHAPFSWIAFILIATFVLACILPFILRAIRSANLSERARKISCLARGRARPPGAPLRNGRPGGPSHKR